MPKYFAPGELLRANALFNSGLYVSILLGLLMGGLLITEHDGGKKVAALLFVAALIGWTASLFAPKAKANAPSLHIDWNIFTQSFRIFQFAFRAPGVIRPMTGIAFFYFTSTNITVLTPIYVRDALHGPGAAANLIMGLYAIGAGAGALSASFLSKGRSGLGLSAFGIFAATAVTIAAVCLTPIVAQEQAHALDLFVRSRFGVALAVCLTLSATFMSLYIVPLQAAMQRRAPAETRSRIMAASNMSNAAAAAAGSLFALVVTQTSVSSPQAFLIVAALQLLVLGYMTARRINAPSGLHDDALHQ